jgi:hypothetical protein
MTPDPVRAGTFTPAASASDGRMAQHRSRRHHPEQAHPEERRLIRRIVGNTVVQTVGHVVLEATPALPMWCRGNLVVWPVNTGTPRIH